MTAYAALDRTVRLIRDAVQDIVTDHEIINSLQSYRVKLVADKSNLESYSGQTCLVTLASLVARMGIQVVLEIPDVALVRPQPPLNRPTIREALIDFGADCIPGTAIVNNCSDSPNLTLVLGDTAAPRHQAYWRLTGDEWSGKIAHGGSSGSCWSADCPIGAMTASALAAGEIFKAVVRGLRLRQVWDEILAPCHSASWDFQGPSTITLARRPVVVDLVSAGAIAQSVLYVLYRLPVPLVLRVFDSDTTDITNLNRQMLARRSDSGLKVDILAKHAPPSFSCTPISEHFSSASSSKYLPLADHVLIGVDNIPSRWELQLSNPKWLGVGATTHYEVSTSSHEGHLPCAGCLHPVDDQDPTTIIPTISFVSFWSGLSLAVRFIRAVLKTPYLAEQQHLWMSALRIGDENAARYFPVAPRQDCPVRCRSSRLLP